MCTQEIIGVKFNGYSLIINVILPGMTFFLNDILFPDAFNLFSRGFKIEYFTSCWIS